MFKDIAIVVLNWNGKDYLRQFLPTLIKYSGNARIIVADNASTDDSVTFLKQNFPKVEIIINAKNGGFAQGYNEALAKVDATYYAIINSDIEVTENWLSPLLEAIQVKAVASVQPKILAFHAKDKFEHAGAAGGFMDRNMFLFCRGRLFDTLEEDSKQYNGESEVFWTSGACMLIKSEAFHAVNGFDGDFFAHMEEVDLCWRMKRLGYSLKVVPSATVYHVGGGTLNYESPNKVYLNFRNSLFLITKNYQGLLFLKLVYRMLLDGLACLQYVAKGKIAFSYAVLRAHGSFYRGFYKMYRKRKAFSPDKSLFNKKGYYAASILWAYFFKGIRKFSDLNQRLFN